MWPWLLGSNNFCCATEIVILGSPADNFNKNALKKFPATRQFLS